MMVQILRFKKSSSDTSLVPWPMAIAPKDPPVLLLENVLNAEECQAFVESMRGEDGSFPERLGQANLDVLLGVN